MYLDYSISQSGKNLTLTNVDKIVVNKYENKISRIIFLLDGTTSGRFCVARQNPITKKYWISPLMEDSSFIITANVSKFLCVCGLISLASDDPEFDEFDNTKITYISIVTNDKEIIR